MNLKSTVYGVYIIESLDAGEYEDGDNLRSILDQSNQNVVYNWADSKEHFKKLLTDFRSSKLRYLYLSCHANLRGIFINNEFISNKEFQEFIGPIPDVRIFMSACKAANRDLANRMIQNCGALSLIGTPLDLDFDKAAIFWPGFFYLMKEFDQRKMSRTQISSTLKKLVDLFNVPINYYSRIREEPLYIRRLRIRQGKSSGNDKLLIKIKDR